MASRRPLESPESSSPKITRLVAAALRGRWEPAFAFRAWEKLALEVLNRLPPGLAQRIVRWNTRLSALPSSRAADLATADLVEERLSDYAGLPGSFDCIVVGSALGGAAAHLAAVLGAPFLPQAFVLGLRGGSPQDEVEAHLARTRPVAAGILERNPDLMAISHFDPVHDHWLTGVLSHLRLKLIGMPAGYRRFIGERLRPGGTILFLDCEARWLRFRLGERMVCQIGGWGDLGPEEFIEGSERIDRFLSQEGSPHRGGWRPGEGDLEEGPESEWGTEPGLAEALQAYAESGGFHFERIRMDHPHDFSALAYEAHEALLRRTGRRPQGVLVEIFTQYDPYMALAARLLPLWLIFNTADSLRFLQSFRDRFPQGVPVFFSALVTLSRTPDMASWQDWARALEGLRWENIGARPERFPEDLTALWRWQERLKKRMRLLPPAELTTLPVEDLLQIAERGGRASGP